MAERYASTDFLIKTWSTASDPSNPLQFPKSRKWINVFLISVQATLTPLSSTLPAIATPFIANEFRTTSTITPVLPVALCVLGLGIGPLYLAPLSETWGRRIVYLVSFTIFGLLNIGCALAPSLAALSVLRFLSGMAGSAGPSLGGASIGDMFVPSERGKAQALYGLGPTFGPVLGGVLGGFILNGTKSWRWLLWVTAIAPGVTVPACALLLKETYAPVLLRREAKRLRKEFPERRFRTEFDDVDVKGAFLASSTRPIRMLLTDPVCASTSLLVGVAYGIFYLHLLSLTLLFAPVPQYGLFTYRWSLDTTGLSWLGVGVGIIIGSLLSVKYANRVVTWRNKKAAMKCKSTAMPIGDQKRVEEQDLNIIPQIPESRLFLLQVSSLVMPVGLIIYAWSAGRTHWIVPLIGAAVFSSSMIVAYVAFQTYMVDVYERWAASALATSIVVRQVVGCVFAMIGFELYKNLGYAWGTMLLVFLGFALSPIPIVLTIFGPRLRGKIFQF